MSSEAADRRRFFIQRISRFWKQFGKSRRGLVGIAILVIFLVMALGAQWIAPYDPVKLSSQSVAGPYAAPAWLNFGTSASLYSANVFPIGDPTFSSSSAVSSWHVNSSITSDPNAATLRYDPNAGRPAPGSGPGSLEVMFTRNAATAPYGAVVVRVFTPFQYPYPASPFRIVGNVFVLPASNVNVTYRAFIIRLAQADCPIDRQLIVNSSYVVGRYPGCYPLTQTVYPGPLHQKDNWLNPGTIDTSSSDTTNIFLTGLNSTQPSPERELFPRSGNYVFGIEMAFQDKTPGAATVDIHFDDVQLQLLGRNYGLLGTDQFGVDLFSQLVYGARVSLLVGLLSAAISVIVGLVVGLIAGFLGGIADEVLMRFTDMLLVLPFLPLLIVMIAILGASIWNVIIVISFLGWMGFARVVRSQVLSLKERPFVEAARAVGAGSGRIIRTHIVPNVMSLTYVTLALSVPAAIVTEAALSFLGLSDPTVTSWGHTIFNAENFEGFRNLWWVIPPGLAIATVSLSFILLGYALDEILNPKLRLRR